MKLSIITVNLNNRDGLKKTIDSVVCQAFKDFEWIIIDGGSTDGSKELIEKYSEHFSYWVSEPDKGIYNAMNKGICAANGDYCFFLNSGDYLIADDSLQQAFDFNFTEDIVYGFFKYDKGDHFEIGISPETITLRTFVEGTIHHTGNVFIRRELFDEDKYGLYDESLRIVSDWKWFLQAVGLGTATTRYIDIMLSVFDFTGLSSCNYNLCEAERERTLKDLIPARILNDYLMFHKLDDKLYMQELKIRSSKSYRLGAALLKPLKCLKQLIQVYE